MVVPTGERVPPADQRLVMHNVPWSHFEAQLALRGEAPVPRMAYLEGVLELMSPPKDHERIKAYIGRLVEAYALERGIELSPYGGWTLKSGPKAAGVEPDECYLVGIDQQRDRPDLAIEVIWTSRGIGKLEIYRRLDVGEVWFWKDGAIEVHVLRGAGYENVVASAVFPQLDLLLLASFLYRPTATQAIRDFRDALRASRGR
jgi:Uma2 family endonuclease